MLSFPSTRALACAIAGLVAGGVTTLAALTYAPPEPVTGVATTRAPATTAPQARAVTADQVGELALVGLKAVPSALAEAEPAEAPAAQPARTPTEADLALRRGQASVGASRGAQRVGTGLTAWPATGALTGTYGEQRASHRHAGIDIDAGYGAPVLAAGAGTVVAAGWAPAAYSGYGMIVIIDHGGGVQTLSAHLSSVSVGVGQVVGPGEVVGAVGTTGSVTGPHLHFEVRVGGTPVDPLHWLPAR